ncbi:MAG: hypothetical protein C0187_01615 [Calditerrivibrio nitroreducens]|jgi:hypothetical protein|uniref:Transposase n=3 Tax=Pseudomonadati TaxID=3379134 RepID=A0AAU8H3Y0_9BACT|nr:MAG: hypothetical protein C0187_01615 [Calditerrivibrio nitroreducens]
MPVKLWGYQGAAIIVLPGGKVLMRGKYLLRDNELVEKIKTGHPFWGYRRVTAWLRHREGLKVNHKRVQGIMKKHGLLTPRQFIRQRGVLRGANPGLKDRGSIGE